ncbi:hypothetical protein FOL47_007796 [Perkinsus chesapeaki]|uniref:Uncharacterized protein n=1 Tax=Perkinsus chesapeaki TaxID=330153 RepID=A0A7J6LIN8_PERCH|nr:hypothetical protein FOL47_007796 [Perkinsus chesapeaki]
MTSGRIMFAPTILQAYARMLRTLKEAMPGDVLTQREMRLALRGSLRDNYSLYPEQAVLQELNDTINMLRYNIVQSEIVPSSSPGEARMRVTLTQEHISQGKPIELRPPWEEATTISADEFENAVDNPVNLCRAIRASSVLLSVAVELHFLLEVSHVFGNKQFNVNAGEEEINDMFEHLDRYYQTE